jgi:GH15 family glucan-1,4-alpha-glucosidase
VYSDGLPGRTDRFYTFDTLIVAYDREYRFVFEAADKAEFDKYRSTVESMAKSIRITQPNFEGINC